MRKLFIAAATWTAAGLAAGLFYREFTKLNQFPEGAPTQLAGVHTHLLALGTLVLLIVLALESTLELSRSRAFRWFFWTYNLGLLVTAAMMIWHGSLTVLGQPSTRIIADIAGTGHALIGAGFTLLLVTIGTAIRRRTEPGVIAVAQA